MTDDTIDRMMMSHCIALSKASGEAGEYPYAAVICRNGVIVVESINRVAQDADVTRHAEVVAISEAQKTLAAVSLEDCEIYVNAEPCVFCCYAIRESRIRRVVYGLKSPRMGGVSKWNVLGDTEISDAMPEVFAPPPEIISGYMAKDAERALVEWNPLVTEFLRQRGLFGTAPGIMTDVSQARSSSLRDRVFRFLRRNVFDYFGRR